MSKASTVGIRILDHIGNPVQKYKIAIEYDASNNPLYIGEAIAGTATSEAGWRIKKITYDASYNPILVAWADGVNTFTKVYDDRTGYTYS